MEMNESWLKAQPDLRQQRVHRSIDNEQNGEQIGDSTVTSPHGRRSSAYSFVGTRRKFRVQSQVFICQA